MSNERKEFKRRMRRRASHYKLKTNERTNTCQTNEKNLKDVCVGVRHTTSLKPMKGTKKTKYQNCMRHEIDSILYDREKDIIEETTNRRYSRVYLEQDMQSLVNMLIKLSNRFYWFVTESQRRKNEYREPSYGAIWGSITDIHKDFINNAKFIWDSYYMNKNDLDVSEVLDILTECRTAYSVCKHQMEILRLATRIPVDIYLDENIDIDKE
jgi:hypothetical protein